MGAAMTGFLKYRYRRNEMATDLTRTREDETG